MLGIKDFLDLGVAIIILLAVTKGPGNLAMELRKLEFSMLEQATSVNWGDPRIWPHKEDLSKVRLTHHRR